jgi:aarF domain-containing kinase
MSECEPAPTPAVVPVAIQHTAEESESYLKRLRESIARYVRTFTAKVRQWWRMFCRTARLLGIFLPVVSTLPIAMAMQYEAFTDTKDHTNFWWWRALRLAVRASGPCTTKLSQWIATRPDLFPFCLCRNMQELQLEAAPPTGATWADTQQALVDAIGPEWHQLYHIDEGNVLGSGCIAQVMHGHVIATQQPIAVKIIHKNVADTIATDIEIMQYIISWIELLPGTHNLSMTECVDEFHTLMMSQLDLRKEAAALLRFRKNFQCDSKHKMWEHESGMNKVKVTFPEPLAGLAFENVLFETFEEGEVISKYLEPRLQSPFFPVNPQALDAEVDPKTMRKNKRNMLQPPPVVAAAAANAAEGGTPSAAHGHPGSSSSDKHTLHALATAGVLVMLKMIFEDNFIHADLHSGNIIVRNLRTRQQEEEKGLVRREGEGLVVSMIDAGLTAELNDEDRRNFLDLFKGLVLNDGRLVGRLMIERNNQQDRNITLAQSEAFQERMHELVNTVHTSGLALGRISVGDLLQKVLVSCYKNNVKLDSKFVSIMLSIGVMEGMGRRLDPDVDLLRSAAPFVLKASAKFAVYHAAKTLHNAQKEHAERHPGAPLSTFDRERKEKDWIWPDR